MEKYEVKGHIKLGRIEVERWIDDRLLSLFVCNLFQAKIDTPLTG